MVILSDLSEVLVNGVDKIPAVINERYGAEAKEDYERRFCEIEDIFHDLLRGCITEEKYFNIFLNHGDLPLTAEGMKEIYDAEFRKIIPGTLETYTRIKRHPQSFGSSVIDKNFPMLYIVSDHIDEHVDDLLNEHIDIFSIVYDQVWSCDIGMIKRDDGFFPMLLKKLGLKPEECVFVDDRSVNIVAAQNAGIYSIKFFNAKQLEEELEKIGFEFYA